MSGQPSTLGFGWQLYGSFPFGSSDWAEAVTWGVIPLFYKEDDIRGFGTVPEPLRKLIDSLKPLLEELRFKWSEFPFLWDANRCPISNLPQLAYSVGLTDDESRPEALRRSRILNVAQLILYKGNDKGYQIVGAFEGLLVTITPLWASDCSPTAVLGVPEPTVWTGSFDDFPADALACDASYDDEFARWPYPLETTGACRSAMLDLHFYAAGGVEIEDFQNVAERINEDLERVTPIHVRVRNVSFDGPRGVGGGWTVAVAADQIAVGGGWSLSVSGASVASSAWNVPVVGVPTT